MNFCKKIPEVLSNIFPTPCASQSYKLSELIELYESNESVFHTCKELTYYLSSLCEDTETTLISVSGTDISIVSSTIENMDIRDDILSKYIELQKRNITPTKHSYQCRSETKRVAIYQLRLHDRLYGYLMLEGGGKSNFLYVDKYLLTVCCLYMQLYQYTLLKDNDIETSLKQKAQLFAALPGIEQANTFVLFQFVNLKEVQKTLGMGRVTKILNESGSLIKKAYGENTYRMQSDQIGSVVSINSVDCYPLAKQLLSEILDINEYLRCVVVICSLSVTEPIKQIEKCCAYHPKAGDDSIVVI